MDDAGFEKLSRSDNPLYGPRKLLLCGFEAEAQAKFAKLMALLNLTDLPLIWVGADQAGMSLAALLELPDNSGGGLSSSLPRAVIMSGITETELYRLMGGCKKAGMQAALWAALTPTSQGWTVAQLLRELSAERQAMAALKAKDRF